jgi:single-strand DNA-binding protein
MMNGCFLVGTVMEPPIIGKGSDKACSMIVETDRMFRNEDGSLDEDFFFVEIWRGIAEEVRDCCKVGTVVAIKGRLVSKREEDGTCKCHVIAEHVTYPHRRNVITKTKE